MRRRWLRGSRGRRRGAGEGGSEVRAGELGCWRERLDSGLYRGTEADIRGGAVDGDAAGTSVGDDEGAHVWRDAGDAGLLAGAGDGDLAAAVEVDDADRVGAGVGDVGAPALCVDADEVGLAVDADGGGDACWLRRR